MKYALRLMWLVAVVLQGMGGVRAGTVVLSPIDGFSRATSHYTNPDDGSEEVDTWTERRFDDIFLYSYEDGRYIGTVSSTTDQTLIYDLRGLSRGTLSQAMLRLGAHNGGYLDAPLDLEISGKHDGGLAESDFSLPNVYYTSLDVPPLGPGEAESGDFDVTRALTTLIGQGFDYATLVLSTYGDDTTGPSQVDITDVPTLTVTGPGISPNASVPEASSIIHLGLAVVGLGLYSFRGKALAR